MDIPCHPQSAPDLVFFSELPISYVKDLVQYFPNLHDRRIKSEIKQAARIVSRLLPKHPHKKVSLSWLRQVIEQVREDDFRIVGEEFDDAQGMEDDHDYQLEEEDEQQQDVDVVENAHNLFDLKLHFEETISDRALIQQRMDELDRREAKLERREERNAEIARELRVLREALVSMTREFQHAWTLEIERRHQIEIDDLRDEIKRLRAHPRDE